MTLDEAQGHSLLLSALVVLEVEHQEFSEWRWLPVDQLVANIVPFKREVYEQVVAEFTPYL